MTKKEKPHRSPLRRIFELLKESLLPAKKHDKPVIEGSQRHLSTAHPLARDDNAVMAIGIAPTAMPKIGQQLFVVWDAIGDGRVVGVFSDEQLAKKLLTVNPFYYRYYSCQFGRPTDDAIGWLDDKDKAKLACIMNEAAYSSPDTDQVFADAAQEGLIRPASAGEIDRMVDIWLSASIQAHNFISSDFWHKGAEDMRQKYLPTSENWVYCEGSRIIGFFSLQQNSLVALFVAPGRQNRGIGTLLLHKARQLRQSLSLTVYEENRNAIDFYCHHGFKVMIAQKDPHTGHSELLMEYSET